jgi:hypothetical protein
MNCTNCKKELLSGQAAVFHDVIICLDCHKMATTIMERAKAQVKMMLLVYADILRVALIKGTLQFPELPVEQLTIPDIMKGVIEKS